MMKNKKHILQWIINKIHNNIPGVVSGKLLSKKVKIILVDAIENISIANVSIENLRKM